MTEEAFEEARLLVRRARQHIDDLNSEFDRYITDEPWRGFCEPNAEGNEYIYRFGITKQLDPYLKTVAADAVNNLRSALDHIVAECARLNGAVHVERLYFPFASSSAELDQQLAGRKYRCLPPKVRDYIRGTAPNPEGDDRLYALTRISGGIKHWKLMPVSVGVRAVKFRAPDGQIKLIQTDEWAQNPRGNITLFTSSNPNEQYNLEILTKKGFDAEVVFNGATGPYGSHWLGNLADLIERAIDDCEVILRELGLI